MLDPQAVTRLYDACTYDKHDDAELELTIEGIVYTQAFNKAWLMQHRVEICDMLDQLPEAFRRDGGGGWSFLNACLDRDGNQWTGEHRIMEQLFMLGMGIGVVTFLFPRSMWDVLPGGMPYVEIHPQGAPA